MFAIVGVTGHTGRIAAETLLARGAQVRAIVRDAAKGTEWQARGADVAVASLDDVAALTKALTGVQGAYLLSPPETQAADFLANRRALLDAMTSAVAASRVPHVVFLSSIGAQVDDPRTGPIASLRYAEQRLGALDGPAVTLLRAPYFTENWLVVAEAITGQGVLPSFIPLDLTFEMASVRDIGRVAAEALLAGGYGLSVIELGGPAPVTVPGVAGELSRTLGRPIQPVPVPVDQVEPTFTSLGLSADISRLYRLMYEGMQAGLLQFEGGGARFLRGAVTPGDALGAALGGTRSRTA